MAIKEQDKVFYEELANGDKVINLPITRANNIEGIGRSASTVYVVGDVAYVDNNKKVALKCIQAGTTSNSELNVSTANIGDTVTDGSVVWQVCNRTTDVTSVNGKTGDVAVGEVTDIDIDGTTITATFADQSTKDIKIPDGVVPKRYVVETFKSGYDWYEVCNDGWVRQGGCLIQGQGATTITFLKPFADAEYTVYGAMCSNSSETSSTRRALAIVQENKPSSPTSITISGASYGNKYWATEGQGAD